MNPSIMWDLLRYYIYELQKADFHSKDIKKAIEAYMEAWTHFDKEGKLS